MEEITQDSKLRIALDVEFIDPLMKFVESEKYDPTGEVMTALENNKLVPSTYKPIPLNERPLILQDRFLGKWSFGGTDNRDKRYNNIRSMYQVYKAWQEGLVELCLTPTCYQIVVRHAHLKRFVSRNDFTILRVRNEDASEFYNRRKQLIKEYKLLEVIGEEFDEEGNHRHRPYLYEKLAESAMFGLPYLVKNSDIVVNRDNVRNAAAQDIQTINESLGYLFDTPVGPRGPRPLHLDYVGQMIRKIKKTNNISTFTTYNSNIDEEGYFVVPNN